MLHMKNQASCRGEHSHHRGNVEARRAWECSEFTDSDRKYIHWQGGIEGPTSHTGTCPNRIESTVRVSVGVADCVELIQ